MKRTLIARLLIIAALLLAVFAYRQCQQRRQSDANSQQTEHATKTPRTGNANRPDDSKPSVLQKKQADVPAYVLKVLDYVEKRGEAPDGYVGGRTFQNREHRLQEKDPKGRVIRYREWDVHPKVEGKNRGAERLITGSDQSAWYTQDHYKTFVKVKRE